MSSSSMFHEQLTSTLSSLSTKPPEMGRRSDESVRDVWLALLNPSSQDLSRYFSPFPTRTTSLLVRTAFFSSAFANATYLSRGISAIWRRDAAKDSLTRSWRTPRSTFFASSPATISRRFRTSGSSLASRSP